MARKKLPKDVDFAAGFFSVPTSEEKEEQLTDKIKAPTETSLKETEDSNSTNYKKNLGGRPKKKGLRNEKFSFTMNPETYEKLRIIANEYTRGNFSSLINNAITAYCQANNINLSKIKVDPLILETYRKKQEQKSKEKK